MLIFCFPFKFDFKIWHELKKHLHKMSKQIICNVFRQLIQNIPVKKTLSIKH